MPCMTVQDEVNELRYEWGTCAVCGEDAPNWNAQTISAEYQYATPPDVNQPQMLCATHRSQYRLGRAKSFKRWVENHSDSHLIYHLLEIRCPDCRYCTGCEDELAMPNDYFCSDCRYGY